MSVTSVEMQSKLLTIDQVKHELGKTEPLTSTMVTSDQKVRFHLGEDWAAGLDSKRGLEQVEVTVDIDGVERPLTKDAILQAASNVGIQKAYAKKTPARLIEENLNYWYSSAGLGDTLYSALAVKDVVNSFTKATIIPFSNLELLENVEGAIRQRYGHDTQIMADYKFQNTFDSTNIRLIVPEHERVITDTGLDGDTWSAGVHVTNSLTGKKQTSIEAYLFRWWCTNGATENLDQVGLWNRRLNGQDQAAVSEWARTSVDEVLRRMEDRFNQVQSLTGLDVTGNITDVAREVFDTYRIPVAQRASVIDALANTPGSSLSMYSVMQAVTQAANDPELSETRRDQMMRIGGKIPSAHFDPMKARVFREGQSNPNGTNPYEIPSAV